MKRAYMKAYNKYGICIKTFGGNSSDVKKEIQKYNLFGFETTFRYHKRNKKR
jgi:hypothetical protein